tara:strand:- start:133 stop:528 length:396 start_codon:yes stop_codon:yes gene_type:complete
MEKIEYVNRMRYATDPELEYYHYDEDYDFEVESPMAILREASEEHGERFASQLEGVADSHFPKRYGKEQLRVEWGYDYLDSYWKEPMRIRKDGKFIDKILNPENPIWYIEEDLNWKVIVSVDVDSLRNLRS